MCNSTRVSKESRSERERRRHRCRRHLDCRREQSLQQKLNACAFWCSRSHSAVGIICSRALFSSLWLIVRYACNWAVQRFLRETWAWIQISLIIAHLQVDHTGFTQCSQVQILQKQSKRQDVWRERVSKRVRAHMCTAGRVSASSASASSSGQSFDSSGSRSPAADRADRPVCSQRSSLTLVWHAAFRIRIRIRKRFRYRLRIAWSVCVWFRDTCDSYVIAGSPHAPNMINIS